MLTLIATHLLHEEVIHAAVVVGRREDVQSIVLPLGRFQGNAADLHTAPPPHLRRRLLVLLAVPDPLSRSRLQVRTVRGRRAFWETKMEKSGITMAWEGSQCTCFCVCSADIPCVFPASLWLDCFSLGSFFSPCLVLLQNRIFPLILLNDKQFIQLIFN